jgi:hypothetical protein
MRFSWLLAAFAALACGGDAERGEACDRDWPNDGPSGTCESGLLCANGVCRTECENDSDCPSDCTCSHGALGVDSTGHCAGSGDC